MKGYTKIHGIAHCQNCDFEDEDYKTASKSARKHHKLTGHKVDVELGFWRLYGDEQNNS